MAARLGIVTGQGLGENLRQLYRQPWLKYPLMLLIIAAVVIGNSAYQGGNISGASMGADALWQQTTFIILMREQGIANPWAMVFGLIAITVLWQRNYQLGVINEPGVPANAYSQ
jgi:manganese transport protein